MSHWTLDDTQLDSDARDLRRGRSRQAQERRAYDAGYKGRPWDDGDPGRVGSPPWRPFCREFYDYGVEDRGKWLTDDWLARKRAREERERQGVAKLERELARERAKRRKVRAERAWKIAGRIAPKSTRTWRRYRRAVQKRRRLIAQTKRS